jgi:DnaJ-domain-containing protein 1
MQTALRCPHCDEKTVVGAKKVNIVRGLVLFFRHGHSTHIGCESCLSTQVGKEFLGNLFLGWWSLYGLFLTPLCLVSNIFTLFSGTRDAFLRETLGQVGLSPNDYEVDASGFTQAERDFHSAVLNVLIRAAWSDGRLEASEIEACVQNGRLFLPDSFLEKEIEFRLRNQDVPPLVAHRMADELKVLLFRVAIQIVQSDGKIEDQELEFLTELGRELGFQSQVVEEFMRLAGLRGGYSEASQQATSSDLAWAARALGIASETSVSEAKKAYRNLCLQHHPDRLQGDQDQVADANRKMAELNKAYAIFTKYGRL